jgi:glycogen debranching enzyme
VLRLFTGLCQAAEYWEPSRFPELFCGFTRRRAAPTLYPVACAPQAWASACVFALVQASLGITFDHGANALQFDRPALPHFLEYVHLRGLRLNGSRADVLFRRLGGEVAATVTEREGTLRIVTVH